MPNLHASPIRFLAPLALAAAALCPAPSGGAEDAWVLSCLGEERPLPVQHQGGEIQFSLSTLADALDLSLERIDRRGAVVEGAGGRIVLQARRTVALVSDEVVLLSRAPSMEGRELFVPADFVESALGRIVSGGLRPRIEPGRLLLEAGLPLRYAWRRAGDREELVLQPPAGAASRLAVHREGQSAVVDSPWPIAAGGDPSEGLGRLETAGRSLRLRPAPGYRVVPAYAIDGLRLSLVPAAMVQGPPENAPPATESPKEALTAEGTTGLFRMVVLDPGHGGGEKGAVGPGGLEEKEITLDLARRLRHLLEGSGVEVALTREDDREMPLSERTSFANQLRADLFVSLHANASPATDVVGSETFFLSREATDELSRKIAAIESNTLGLRGGRRGPTPGALEMTLWEMAQSQFLQESQRLAQRIQRELNQVADTPDRGVRQAPLTVLMGATMPAVLVEVGYLSNPAEERKLRDDDHRDRVAQALHHAILAFGEERRRRLQGSS